MNPQGPPPPYNYMGPTNPPAYSGNNYPTMNYTPGDPMTSYPTAPNAAPNMAPYQVGFSTPQQAQTYYPTPNAPMYNQNPQPNCMGGPGAPAVFVPQAQFDAGARFSPNNPPVIPPPPPGYAPNVAQQLSQSGCNVQAPQSQYGRDPGWTLW